MSPIQVLSASTVRELESAALELRHQVFHVDLVGVDSKSKLIRAVAEGMELPDYCGTNWDGLEECLRDLGHEKGWLLVFDNADQVLRLEKPLLATFFSILSDTILSFLSKTPRRL